MSASREHIERHIEQLVGAENTSVHKPWPASSDAEIELPLACPADEAQARALLRLAAADGLRILVCGAGSKLALEAPRENVDFALSATRLRGVIAFEPADGTLTAWAGTPMSDLAHMAAEGGRRLTPHIANTAATLGGAIATAQTGNDRLRYGPLRDQLLGMRALLSADISSKSGGRLVKNVAGYDLHRAHCGGRGRLGLIVEATLRLHPALARELHVARPVDGIPQALALSESALSSGARPLGVRIHELEGDTTLHIHLGGREDVVQHELELLTKLCGELTPAPPLESDPVILQVNSLRSGALIAAEWAASVRSQLAPSAALVLDPGIASAQLRTKNAPAPMLEAAQLRALPEGLQVVRPTGANRSASAGVLALESGIQNALDPLGLFA